MILLASFTVVKCGLQHPFRAIGRAEKLVFRKFLVFRSQAMSIVSVARVTGQRQPSVMINTCYPPDPLMAEQKFRYLSIYFCTDGGRAKVAYAFPIAKGADPIETLESYASKMQAKTQEEGNEYDDAFQSYVKKLRMEEIPLPPPIQSLKRATTRDSVLDILLPGKKRDEEIELCLRQGLSFIDMKPIFQRTAAFLAREADRNLGRDVVQTLLKRKKRTEWSHHEMQHLMALRKQGLPHSRLAAQLRRRRQDVQKQLRELETALTAPGAVQGPQELPPGLRESLFHARLVAVWQALLRSEMAPTWRETLLSSDEDWLSKISEGIPNHVKKALGGLGPPTWHDLESFPLMDTTDADVYARLATTQHEFHMASDRFLYIGSATKYGGGLNWRIAEHTIKRKPKHESRLQHDIRTKRLKDSFVTLMVMKMDNAESEAVLKVRTTVILAEAVLTIWLGALKRPPGDLQNVYPWDVETIQWTDWASHNPLMDDVTLPGNYNINPGATRYTD